MKKNFKKFLAVAITIVLSLGTISPILTEADSKSKKDTGSITIKLKNQSVKDENLDVNDYKTPDKGTIEYTIYMRAEYVEDLNNFKNPQGEICQTVDVATHLVGENDFAIKPELKKTPKRYISKFNGTDDFITKSNDVDASEIVFNDLPKGRYFVLQTEKNDGTNLYNSFIVDIPGFTYDDNGKLINTKDDVDIVVFPKNELILTNLWIKTIDGFDNKSINTDVSIEKTAGTKSVSSSLGKVGDKYFIKSNENTILNIPSKSATDTEENYLGKKIEYLQPGSYLVNVQDIQNNYTYNNEDIEFTVENDGSIKTFSQNDSYGLEVVEDGYQLVIKNYKPITADGLVQILDASGNIKEDTNGIKHAYFDSNIEPKIKWKTIIDIPKNIGAYEDLKLKITNDAGIKLRQLEGVTINDIPLKEIHYTHDNLTFSFTQSGINFISTKIKSGIDKLEFTYNLEFDKEGFSFDKIEHSTYANLEYKASKNKATKPTKPENNKGLVEYNIAEEAASKMITGHLPIKKTIQTPESGSTVKASDVKLRLKSKIGDVEVFMKLEKKGDVYYPVGTTEIESEATILDPPTNDTDPLKAKYYIYGLMISDSDVATLQVNYFLEEYVAPVGYNKIAKDIDVSVTSAKPNHDLVEVYNRKGVKLPPTGGIGIALILVSVGTLYILGKKKEKDEENKETTVS